MTDRDQLRDRLTDLERWTRLLDDVTAALRDLHSPRFDGIGGGGSKNEAVPFRLAQTWDDDTEGGNGIRTRTGAEDLFGSYARTVARELGQATYTGSPMIYLASVATNISEETLTDGGLAEAVDAAWVKVGAITGNGWHRDDLAACPSCGGPMMRQGTDKGLSDWLRCSSCGETYADDGHAQAVRHHTITASQAEDVWITREQALTLNPSLKPDTLKKWIKRGHVTRNGKLLNLSDINARTHHTAA